MGLSESLLHLQNAAWMLTLFKKGKFVSRLSKVTVLFVPVFFLLFAASLGGRLADCSPAHLRNL